MVFRSLVNISISKILLNRFKIKHLSKPLQPNLEAPINHLFKDLNFNYETDSTSSTLYRFNSWFIYVIMFETQMFETDMSQTCLNTPALYSTKSLIST